MCITISITFPNRTVSTRKYTPPLVWGDRFTLSIYFLDERYTPLQFFARSEEAAADMVAMYLEQNQDGPRIRNITLAPHLVD